LANFYDQTCFFSYILFLEESSGAVDIDEYHIYAANRSTQLNGDSMTADIVEGGFIREPLEN
jgi:hypothetical protein